MMRSERRTVRFTAAPMLLCLAAAWLLSCSSPASAASFCEQTVVNDYPAPLEAFPSLPPFPSDNDLPFGPGRLYIAETLHPLVITQENNIGVRLEYGPGAAGPTPRLNWLVTGRLVRLFSDGRRGRVIESRLVRVRRMQPGNRITFRFPISADPSLYRLELVFHGQSGRRLGRFGEYFRVLPRVSDLRLGLSGTSFRPGEKISTCIENYGTTELTFGACDPGFEHFDGATWSPFPPGGPFPCIAIAYSLAAGTARPGSRLTIPTDAPVGLYRAVLGGATAEFQVLAPG